MAALRNKGVTHRLFFVRPAAQRMTRKQNSSWTAEEERRLLEMKAAGRSAFSIGAALHRSPGAINARYRDLQNQQKRAQLEKSSGRPASVWVYVNVRHPVGHPEHLKIFADLGTATSWFEKHDPEGVVFSYLVHEPFPNAEE